MDCRLCISGDLDQASSPELRSELQGVIGGSDADLLLIDCEQLTFIDSTGVKVLLEARRRLVTEGRDLRLTNVAGTPRRVLEILGLTYALCRER
jgi:anti-sigma B factor antagonist